MFNKRYTYSSKNAGVDTIKKTTNNHLYGILVVEIKNEELFFSVINKIEIIITLNIIEINRVLNNTGDLFAFANVLLLLYNGSSDCIIPFTQKKLIAPERKINFS